MTLRVFVCCRECGFREQGEPYIWHIENNGIICPNCGNQWATEEVYQYRKRLDELWNKYNPTITFEGSEFHLSSEIREIHDQINKEYDV